MDREQITVSLKELDVLRNLSPNWDSYGSPPLTDAAYTRARNFLLSLTNEAKPPIIVPVSGGGVQFEWESHGRELEVEFLQNGEIEYLGLIEAFQDWFKDK